MDKSTRDDYIYDLTAERNQLLATKRRLEAQLDELRQIKTAAQALVDFIHYQKNVSSGSSFATLYENLIQALNNYYQPNGTEYRDR